jgi:hypothetical protein
MLAGMVYLLQHDSAASATITELKTLRVYMPGQSIAEANWERRLEAVDPKGPHRHISDPHAQLAQALLGEPTPPGWPREELYRHWRRNVAAGDHSNLTGLQNLQWELDEAAGWTGHASP